MKTVGYLGRNLREGSPAGLRQRLGQTVGASLLAVASALLRPFEVERFADLDPGVPSGGAPEPPCDARTGACCD
jgi:hypothetical protein